MDVHERLVRFLAPTAAEGIRREFAKVMAANPEAKSLRLGEPKTGSKLGDDIRLRGAAILAHHLAPLLRTNVVVAVQDINDQLFEIRIG